MREPRRVSHAFVIAAVAYGFSAHMYQEHGHRPIHLALRLAFLGLAAWEWWRPS